MTVSITTLVDIESPKEFDVTPDVIAEKLEENWRDSCDYLLDEFVTTKYPLDKFKDNCVYFSSNINGKHYSKGNN